MTHAPKGATGEAVPALTAPAHPAMASPGFRKSIDDFSYALNDLRMFSSILDTLAETKLEGETDPRNWNLPAEFKGSVLLAAEAEEILFLALKVDHMARKLDEMWGALLEAMPRLEERAS